MLPVSSHPRPPSRRFLSQVRQNRLARWALFLLVTLAAVPSQARLGENLKELRRRYGPSIGAESSRDARSDRYTFRWELYTIDIVMEGGLSVSETFTRADKREFTLQEVRYLLRESVEPGLAWTQVDGDTWKQQDRTATWAARSLTVQEKARGR